MKKYLSILLILSVLSGTLLFFFSCNSNATNDDASEKSEADTIISSLSIVKEGKTDYTLVIPNNASNEVKLAADKLREEIYLLTQVYMPILTDDQVENYKGLSLKLILLGNTCFDESAALIDELSSTTEAYAIDHIGESIVIVSNFDSALIQAVDYYIEELIMKNYDSNSNTLYFEGCYHDGETTFSSAFSLKGINNYSIVYSSKVEGFGAIAEMYRKSLQELTGVSLPIYKDVEKKPAPYEILLGYTDRPISEKYFSGSSRIMTYEVIVEKGNLQIAAGGPYSAKKCLWAMEKELFPFIGHTLKSGSYLSTDLAPVSPALTDGAKLRIMSSNILGDSVSSECVLPVSQRLEIYCGVLLRYLPDAVGVQEADTPWTLQIPTYLDLISKLDGIEYSCILKTHNECEQWEPIIYRSDKYHCNYSEYTPAPYWTTTTHYLRGVSRANFVSRANESLQFAIVNAHWNHTSAEKMYSDATEMAKYVKEIQQKYPDSTVFCTGDFNSHYYETKPLYQLLDDVSGFVCSELAKNNGTLQVPCGCRVHGGHGSMQEGITRPYDSDFIDHVIGVGVFEVLRHDTIINNCTNLMSDHSAIYADVNVPL